MRRLRLTPILVVPIALWLGTLATRLSADTFHLLTPTASAVTVNPGQSLTTLSTANSGFTPTLPLSGTPAFWYGPVLNGAFPAGTWSLVIWSNAPGCASPVTAEIGYSNPDGSGYVSLGSQTVDFNQAGNHANGFNYTVGFLNLGNQVLRVTLTQSSGCAATIAYNAGVDFDSRLITTAMGPNGTATVSPTATLSPTATATPIPPLTKSVNATTALVGDTLTYTLHFQNPNPATQASCGDNFESGSTQWPAGWSAPTGGTWTLMPDNGPSAPGVQALDAQTTGGFQFTTLNCANNSTDGQLQVDAKILTANGNLSLLWRQNGASTYQFHITQGSVSNVSLRVITNGGFNEIAVVGQPINLSQWYTLKLVVTGFLLQGYINGVLVISANDPNTTYAAGAAGLEIDDAPATGMHAVFDNVQVTQFQANWYGVTITDTLPSGLSYLGDSCGGTASGQVVSLPLGTLTAGTVGSCQVLALVNSCPALLVNQADFHVSLPILNDTSNSVSTTVSCSTVTATPSPTPTASPTATQTPSPSPSDTPTPSPSASPSPSPSDTPTTTPSPSVTASPTDTPLPSPSDSPSASPTTTTSPTVTWTASPSPSLTSSPSPSATPTASPSFSATSSLTPSPSPTDTPSMTPTPSPSPTASASPSPTPSASPTATDSATPTQTASLTASPSATPSPTISPTPQPFPSTLTVEVYNSAGEIVRRIYQGPATANPSAVQLSAASVVPGSGSVTLLMDCVPSGQASLTWDGRNDQGQVVATGIYYLKVQSTDPFGRISAFNLSVQALAAPPAGQATLDIYNSAGERVASLPLSPSTGISALDLRQTTLVAGTTPGLQVDIIDTTGLVRTLTWDGFNAAGAAVASGIYTLRPRQESGNTTLKTLVFTVLDPAGSAPSAPRLAPNPALASSSVWHIQGPGNGAPWTVDLYDLAGERVRRIGGGAASLDLPLNGLSGGLYLMEIRTQDGQGRVWRWTLKAALSR